MSNYVRNIMDTVTAEIKRMANKQTVSDVAKGRKIRECHSAKWKRLFKLCSYQSIALTGKPMPKRHW